MTWGAIAGAAITVVGGYFANKDKGSSGGDASSGSQGAYDPYAPYRAAAAEKLNSLMADPSQIQSLPEYQADYQAAARAMAAQGYTGSGNALVAAANAGGQAYQQAFNNLSMLAGAGQSPAYAAGLAANQSNYQQQMQNQMWGQIGGIAGRVISNWGNNAGSDNMYTAPIGGSGSYIPASSYGGAALGTGYSI